MDLRGRIEVERPRSRGVVNEVSIESAEAAENSSHHATERHENIREEVCSLNTADRKQERPEKRGVN